MADTLNSFFHSVFNPHFEYVHRDEHQDSSFCIDVDTEGVSKLLRDLKPEKSAGPDKLKKNDLVIVPVIAEVLTCIYQ